MGITLNINENADTTAIKEAYRNLAREHHPDRGGDVEKFKEATEAYEVLKDDEKRSAYDRFGHAAFENGGGGSGGFGNFERGVVVLIGFALLAAICSSLAKLFRSVVSCS